MFFSLGTFGSLSLTKAGHDKSLASIHSLIPDFPGFQRKSRRMDSLCLLWSLLEFQLSLRDLLIQLFELGFTLLWRVTPKQFALHAAQRERVARFSLGLQIQQETPHPHVWTIALPVLMVRITKCKTYCKFQHNWFLYKVNSTNHLDHQVSITNE